MHSRLFRPLTKPFQIFVYVELLLLHCWELVNSALDLVVSLTYFGLFCKLAGRCRIFPDKGDTHMAMGTWLWQWYCQRQLLAWKRDIKREPTASIASMSVPGRLKKNLLRSKTPSVLLNLSAFRRFSRMGVYTCSALVVATVPEFVLRKKSRLPPRILIDSLTEKKADQLTSYKLPNIRHRVVGLRL